MIAAPESPAITAFFRETTRIIEVRKSAAGRPNHRVAVRSCVE
jgi:hypothetical protein